MGFLSRLRDLILARVHRSMDRVEDPAGLVALAIRDMEDALAELRVQAARIIADLKGQRRNIARLKAEQSDWTEKAELALSKGREDLALAALEEKQKAASMGQRLIEEEILLAGQLQVLEADIGRLDGKLQEARAQQKIIMSRIEIAETRKRAGLIASDRLLADNASQLAMLEHRADAAESVAEAQTLSRPSLTDEMSSLDSQHAARKELVEMKKRLGRNDSV